MYSMKSIEITSDSEMNNLLDLYSEEAASDESTLAFWIAALKQYCLHNRRLCFNAEQIIQAYTKRGLVPDAFTISLGTLSERKITTKASKLLETHEQGEGIVDYLSKLVGSLLKLNVNSNRDFDRAESYVCISILESLEKLAQVYAERIYERDRVLTTISKPGFDYTLRQFLINALKMQIDQGNLGSKSCDIDSDSESLLEFVRMISDHDLLILQKQMRCNGSLVLDQEIAQVLTVSEGICYKKIPRRDNLSKVSEVNAAFLRIRLLLHDISKKLLRIEEKIELCTNKALEAKRRDDNQLALMNLQRRKQLKSERGRLLQASDALESCLLTMESSESNEVVFNSYKIAAEALCATRKASNITVESIESAMEMFQSEMNELEDITEALKSPIEIISDEEKETLEIELASILKETQDTCHTELQPQQLQDLPSSPEQQVVLSMRSESDNMQVNKDSYLS